MILLLLCDLIFGNFVLEKILLLFLGLLFCALCVYVFFAILEKESYKWAGEYIYGTFYGDERTKLPALLYRLGEKGYAEVTVKSGEADEWVNKFSVEFKSRFLEAPSSYIFSYVEPITPSVRRVYEARVSWEIATQLLEDKESPLLESAGDLAAFYVIRTLATGTELPDQLAELEKYVRYRKVVIERD